MAHLQLTAREGSLEEPLPSVPLKSTALGAMWQSVLIPLESPGRRCLDGHTLGTPSVPTRLRGGTEQTAAASHRQARGR